LPFEGFLSLFLYNQNITNKGIYVWNKENWEHKD
jgi:hypothetical protein